VYRGIVSPLKSWVDYAVFVSFFPELVAGPIVRARDFTDQLSAPFQSNRQDFGKAIALILGGLFKKVVISDMLSTGLADKVFEQPELASGIETWFAVASYAFQIFCDFSGYTDIAIGLALLLGYHLKPNFNEPYKALSITDFWRRWHISLSSWLRDYLYVPLGGNRKGEARTYINLILVMVLGGLWHGASANFLIWGGIHGGWLALERSMGRRSLYAALPKLLRMAVTFAVVCLAWVFFRASDLPSALQPPSPTAGASAGDEERRAHAAPVGGEALDEGYE
jgi:D-alanyl-lipoteichoic acid acyltransferase DltB (MBOAT superfamily)